MMVAVAVFGSLVSVEAMRRRSHRLRERAEFHRGELYGIEDENPPGDRRLVTVFRTIPTLRPRRGVGSTRPATLPLLDDDPPLIAEWRKSQKKRIGFHETMYRKYEFAAARPFWLTVEPDPPEPE